MSNPQTPLTGQSVLDVRYGQSAPPEPSASSLKQPVQAAGSARGGQAGERPSEPFFVAFRWFGTCFASPFSI